MSDMEHTEGEAGAREESGPVGDVDGLVPVLEALLFAAGDPVTLEEMQSAVPKEDKAQVEPALQRLRDTYDDDHGVQIVPLAGGYRMVTRSAYDRYIRALLRQRNRRRLGRASLETLAIVAYRQPVTGPEISEIRGKDSAGVLKNLLDKRLLRVTGRKKVVGKPFLYGTTREFLLHFGLNSLADLPDMAEFEDMLQERMAQMEEIPLPDQEESPEEFTAGALRAEIEPGEEDAPDLAVGNGDGEPVGQDAAAVDDPDASERVEK